MVAVSSLLCGMVYGESKYELNLLYLINVCDGYKRIECEVGRRDLAEPDAS